MALKAAGEKKGTSRRRRCRRSGFGVWATIFPTNACRVQDDAGDERPTMGSQRPQPGILSVAALSPLGRGFIELLVCVRAGPQWQSQSGLAPDRAATRPACPAAGRRSEEHTSELQSHSFISYAVFRLKKK